MAEYSMHDLVAIGKQNQEKGACQSFLQNKP